MAFKKKEKKDTDLVRIGALWEKETKSDTNMLSGGFDEDAASSLASAFEALGTKGVRLLIFKNTFKKKDSEPDFRVFVAPKTPRAQEEAANTAPAAAPKAAAKLPWQKK